MLILEYLDWDSKFFCKEIFRCDIRNSDNILEIQNELSRLNGDLCYVFSLLKLNIKHDKFCFLADEKVTFVKDLKENFKGLSSQYVVSTNEFSSKLYDLALLSGHKSRFKTDFHLNSQFSLMYKIWLEKSLNHQIADEVFVFQKAGEQLGFVTVKKINEVAYIGLIAVDEKYHRMNIGKSLLTQVESWCLLNGVIKLEVPTQMKNEQACSFYKKNGFLVKKIDYIYHYYANECK